LLTTTHRDKSLHRFAFPVLRPVNGEEAAPWQAFHRISTFRLIPFPQTVLFISNVRRNDLKPVVLVARMIVLTSGHKRQPLRRVEDETNPAQW
jgi:hypothetical protein